MNLRTPVEPLPVLISKYMFCSTQLAWPCPQTASACRLIVFLNKAAVIEKLSLLVRKHLWDEDVEHELWQVQGAVAVGGRIWTKRPPLISVAHPGLYLLSDPLWSFSLSVTNFTVTKPLSVLVNSTGFVVLVLWIDVSLHRSPLLLSPPPYINFPNPSSFI